MTTHMDDVLIVKATEWSNVAPYSPIMRIVIAERLNTPVHKFVCWWENKHEKGTGFTLLNGKFVEWDLHHDFYHGMYCNTLKEALESFSKRVKENRAQFPQQFSTWEVEV